MFFAIYNDRGGFNIQFGLCKIHLAVGYLKNSKHLALSAIQYSNRGMAPNMDLYFGRL